MEVNEATIVKDVLKYNKSEFNDLLNYLSEQYYYNVPIVSDEIFDELVKIYEDKHGKYTANLAAPSGQKVQLPYYISSLRKIIEDKELNNYFKNYPGPWTVEDKIDGLTLLLVRDNNANKLYTHGRNGIGRDVTHLLNYVKFPKLREDIAIRGEIVMNKQEFQSIKGDWKNARNLVGGIINSKDSFNPELAKKLSFYAYRIITSDDKPSDQIGMLKELGFEVPSPVSADKLDRSILESYYANRVKNSLYDIDGLVIYQDVPIDYPDGEDPKQVVAFKMETEKAETVVTKVVWQASKDRMLKPVVHFESTNLSSADLSKASGYNARFIIANRIGPGAKIIITRSGDVIPKILTVIEPLAEPVYPDPKVYGEYEWNENQVEFVLLADNDEVLTNKLKHFVSTLDVKNFGPARLKTLVEHGITSIDDLVNLTVQDLSGIPGIGATLAEQLTQDIQNKLSNVSLPKIMDASGFFTKIGEKRFEMIMEIYPNFLEMMRDDKNAIAEQIKAVKGFDKLAYEIADHLEEFADWLDNHPNITIKKAVKVSKSGGSLSGKTIVFSGFRDKALEEQIKAKGGKIGTSVSGNTSILIVKDLSSTTGKPEEARAKGIPIVLKDDFIEQYLS